MAVEDEEMVYINGRLLRYARKRKGLLQKELAAKLKLSSRTVYRMEKHDECNISHLNLLSQELGLPIALLTDPTGYEKVVLAPDQIAEASVGYIPQGRKDVDEAIEKASDFPDLCHFLEMILAYRPASTGEDLLLISRVYHFLVEKLKGAPERFGMQFVSSCLVSTTQKIALGFDISMLAAALLLNVIEDTPITFEEVEKEFGEDIVSLMKMMNRDTLERLDIAANQKKEYHVKMSKIAHKNAVMNFSRFVSLQRDKEK